MPIKFIQMDFAGQTGVSPRLGRMITTDTYAAVTTPGYLDGVTESGINFQPGDFLFTTYSNGMGGIESAAFTISVTGNVISAVLPTGSGVQNVVGFVNEIDIDNTDPLNPIVSIADNPILPGTAAVILPKGDTSQRPGAPQDGHIRYNTQAQIFEGYQGGIWETFATATGYVTNVVGTINQIDVDNTIPTSPILSIADDVVLPGVNHVTVSPGAIYFNDKGGVPAPIPVGNDFYLYNDAGGLWFLDGTGVPGKVFIGQPVLSVNGTSNEINVDNTDPANPVVGFAQDPIVQGTKQLTLENGAVLFASKAAAPPTPASGYAFIYNKLGDLYWMLDDGIEHIFSGGGGGVASVSGTVNEIDIDNTDPANPIVGLADDAILPGANQITLDSGTLLLADRALDPSTPPTDNIYFYNKTGVLYYMKDDGIPLPLPVSGLSGYDGGTGDYDLFVGSEIPTASGSQNTTCGVRAGDALGGGGNANTLIGAQAGQFTTSNGSTVVGVSASNGATGPLFLITSTIVGYANANSKDYYQNCVFLGKDNDFDAAATDTSCDNVIAIGNGIRTPVNFLGGSNGVGVWGKDLKHSYEGLKFPQMTKSREFATFNTAVGTTTIPINTSSVSITHARIRVTTYQVGGGEAAYCTTECAGFWNGVSSQLIGAAPPVNFIVTSGAMNVTGSWSIVGNDLVLTVTGATGLSLQWVLIVEAYNTHANTYLI